MAVQATRVARNAHNKKKKKVEYKRNGYIIWIDRNGHSMIRKKEQNRTIVHKRVKSIQSIYGVRIVKKNEENIDR